MEKCDLEIRTSSELRDMLSKMTMEPVRKSMRKDKAIKRIMRLNSVNIGKCQ